MIKFLFKRILRSIPIIFGVISISFIFMYIAPGDPALSILGQNYNESKLNEIRDDLNLNRPVMQQYVLYVLKTVYSIFLSILDHIFSDHPMHRVEAEMLVGAFCWQDQSFLLS